MSDICDALLLELTGAASLEKIRAAVEASFEARGKPLEFYKNRISHRNAVFRGAAQRLAAAREDEALLELWQAVPADLPLSRIFIRSLDHERDSVRLRAHWQEIESRHASAPELDALVSEMKARRPDVWTISDYGEYGSLDAPLVEVMESFYDRDSPDLRTARFADALIAQRGLSGVEAATFRKKLYWGAHTRNYFKFITSLINARKITDDPMSHDQIARIEELHKQRSALVVLPEPGALTRAKEKGRTVLLAHAHAGAAAGWAVFVRKLGMKSLLFSANSETGDKPLMHRLSTRSNGAMNFMKAVKMIKRDQHLVRIFPDGGDGGDRIPVDILGCSLDIGAGAGTLAWHGKAATFFGGARWRSDGKLELYLREGPAVDDGTDRETFEAEFAKFYATMLEEIALGAPEDIVGKGGIWMKLARALAEQQEGN